MFSVALYRSTTVPVLFSMIIPLLLLTPWTSRTVTAFEDSIRMPSLKLLTVQEVMLTFSLARTCTPVPDRFPMRMASALLERQSNSMPCADMFGPLSPMQERVLNNVAFLTRLRLQFATCRLLRINRFAIVSVTTVLLIIVLLVMTELLMMDSRIREELVIFE